MLNKRVELKQEDYEIDFQIEEKPLDHEKVILTRQTIINDQTNLTPAQQELMLPLNIFSKEISSLQLIVKYLKENYGLSYAEIARALNRNDRTIWATYHSVKEIVLKQTSQTHDCVPVHIFSNRKLSVLEALVFYLKEERSLKNIEISSITQRNNKTIWTVYERAKKKMKEEA